jgi:hypothetical protein
VHHMCKQLRHVWHCPLCPVASYVYDCMQCRVEYIAAKTTGSHMVVYLCELAIPHPGQAMRDARNGIIHSWLGSHTK